MAISRNHYYYHDLLRDLRKIGETAQADRLVAMDAAVDEALRERQLLAEFLLKQYLPKITPLLRPCHKSQGDKLDVNTYRGY